MNAPATPKQIQRLIDASENLAACFARGACRIIVEGADDMNLAPYLDDLPVKIVREFDRAICAITHPEFVTDDDEAVARAKYNDAMREMRGAL